MHARQISHHEHLAVLAGILYHPIPSAPALTLAAAIHASLAANKALGPEYRHMGATNGGPPDLAEVTLCPALLKEAGLLPDGAPVFPVLRALTQMVGSLDATLRHNNRHIPAVIIHPVIIRALLSTDGNLPPARAQAVAA